jgi:hypothetical protein
MISAGQLMLSHALLTSTSGEDRRWQVGGRAGGDFFFLGGGGAEMNQRPPSILFCFVFFFLFCAPLLVFCISFLSVEELLWRGYITLPSPHSYRHSSPSGHSYRHSFLSPTHAALGDNAAAIADLRVAAELLGVGAAQRAERGDVLGEIGKVYQKQKEYQQAEVELKVCLGRGVYVWGGEHVCVLGVGLCRGLHKCVVATRPACTATA